MEVSPVLAFVIEEMDGYIRRLFRGGETFIDIPTPITLAGEDPHPLLLPDGRVLAGQYFADRAAFLIHLKASRSVATDDNPGVCLVAVPAK